MYSEASDSIQGNSFNSFSGIWSEDEAAEIERAIEESCKQVDPNDWK